MKIEHPDKFYPSELNGQFLWKYIDFFKLLDLISSQELYFQRFDKFEDGLEGLTGNAIFLKFATQGQPLTEQNINKTFDENLQKIAIREDQQRRKEFQDIVNKTQKTQYGNCWFLDNRESLSMWKIYSQEDGVALKFNAQQLTETIVASAENYTKTDFQIMYYGKVEYKNIWPFDPEEIYEGKFNGLKKDRSYRYENEYRFVVVVSPSHIGHYNSFRLPIGNLKDFDVEIITNPFIRPWKINIIKSVLKKYDLSDKIKISTMDINKNYG